jgi:peptidylprolyl isomerase
MKTGGPLKLLIGALICTCATSVAAQDDMVWRQIEPSNTVFMQIGEGEIVFELNPRFAPETVRQFKKLIQDDFYRSLSFYRVIDGFVAQGGDESDIDPDAPNAIPTLKAEFEMALTEEFGWTPVQTNDLFAAETGFIDGFAAAKDTEKVWLTHCPGALAMARGTKADSGSTDFYIVIGQAPRYLDRNLTIFGRVVFGMDVVQKIRRGPTSENGIIAKDEDRSRIKKMVLGSDLAEEDRKEVYVMDTGSDGFETYMKARRNRTAEFFHFKPPQVLDVCQVPVAARIEKPSSLIPDNRIQAVN